MSGNPLVGIDDDRVVQAAVTALLHDEFDEAHVILADAPPTVAAAACIMITSILRAVADENNEAAIEQWADVCRYLETET